MTTLDLFLVWHTDPRGTWDGDIGPTIRLGKIYLTEYEAAKRADERADELVEFWKDENDWEIEIHGDDSGFRGPSRNEHTCYALSLWRSAGNSYPQDRKMITSVVWVEHRQCDSTALISLAACAV